MLIRLVVCALVAVLSRGLQGGTKPGHRTTTRPPPPPKKAFPDVDALKSSLFAVSVCVLHAASPGLCGVAVAIDAGSYADLYGDSLSSGGGGSGLSFSLPGKPPASEQKKRQEAPPSPAPSFELPDMPKVPDLPKVDIPKVEVPSLPSFDIPKVDVPSFSAPKVDLPSFSAPKVDLPSAPSFSAPSLPSFGDPDEKSAPVVDVAALDEVARETYQDFRQADNDAKKVEEEGRRLRKIADGKNSIRKKAKDAACEYRPGGKFLCIRGLNSGF